MTTTNEVRVSKLFQMVSTMAQIVRTTQLTPRMRRVTLGGEGLRPLIGECLPADAIKVYLPLPGQPAFLPKFISLPSWKKQYDVRPYTIRRFDPDALELDIDVFLHGDSPGSVWARTVQPGNQIGFVGPRHEYRGAPGADWQVFAGDESALPAIVAILEQLHKGTRAWAFIEVADESDVVPIETEANAEITWLYRRNGSRVNNTLLEQAILGFTWPSEKGYFWVAGNATVAKRVRRYLQEERHLHKDDMYTWSYWK